MNKFHLTDEVLDVLVMILEEQEFTGQTDKALLSDLLRQLKNYKPEPADPYVTGQLDAPTLEAIIRKTDNPAAHITSVIAPLVKLLESQKLNIRYLNNQINTLINENMLLREKINTLEINNVSENIKKISDMQETPEVLKKITDKLSKMSIKESIQPSIPVDWYDDEEF